MPSPPPSLTRPPPFVGLVVAPASRALPSTLTGGPSILGPLSPGPSSPSSPSGTPSSFASSLPGSGQTPTPPSSASPTVAAFGSRASGSSGRSSGSGGRKSKRPSTSAAVLAANAAPDGTKELTLPQALSLGGAQVTSYRSTTDVLDHLSLPTSPAPSSAFFPSAVSASNNPAPSSSSSPLDVPLVVFLPLNDLSSALVYAANLLRDARNTPTAVCFQPDSVSPAEKIELAVSLSLDGIRAISRDKHARERGVVVVAYSASASLPVEIVKRCERAGADLVVCSPYQTSTLMERIQIAHPKRSTASSVRLDTPSISNASSHGSSTSSRPAPQDLLTMSDLSAPFANLADVIPMMEDAHAATTTRRASVDGTTMSMTLSRTGLGEDGHGDGSEGDEAGEGSEKKGPSRIFAELVSEMHQQVQIAIDVKMEGREADELLGPISLQHRNELIRHLSGWDYRPYSLSQEDLFRCNCLMFEATLAIEGIWELEIDCNQMKRFLLSVKSLYNTVNPYHNYTHGSDVLQATYTFLVALGVAPPLTTLLGTQAGRPDKPWKRPQTTTGRAAEVIRPQDVLTLMIAAIGHDGAHPGLSNAFLKNAKAPLSQVYEDKSALEHLHCILVVSLLKKHGFGWLFGSTSDPSDSIDFTATPSKPVPAPGQSAQVARAAFVDFRKLLFGTILATDMSMHFSWMGSLTEMGDLLVQGGPLGMGSLSVVASPTVGARERQAGKDRLMILQALMKCADISNPARPVEISEYWSSALLDEWNHQATLEIGLALPVSVVKNADAGVQAKGQIAFQDLFVAPLFDAATVVMPELRSFADQCSSNRTLWFQRLSKLTAPDAPSTPRTQVFPESHPAGSPGAEFRIPCALGSRYRTLFPLTLPPHLIATPPPSPEKAVPVLSPAPKKGDFGGSPTEVYRTQRELSAGTLAGAPSLMRSPEEEGTPVLKVAYRS